MKNFRKSNFFFAQDREPANDLAPEPVLVHDNKGTNVLVLEHVPVRMLFLFFFLGSRAAFSMFLITNIFYSFIPTSGTS